LGLFVCLLLFPLSPLMQRCSLLKLPFTRTPLRSSYPLALLLFFFLPYRYGPCLTLLFSRVARIVVFRHFCEWCFLAPAPPNLFLFDWFPPNAPTPSPFGFSVAFVCLCLLYFSFFPLVFVIVPSSGPLPLLLPMFAGPAQFYRLFPLLTPSR